MAVVLSLDQVKNTGPEAARCSRAIRFVGFGPGYPEPRLDILGQAFKEAREAGDTERMARALADPVLAKAFGVGDDALLLLRKKRVNIAEASLCLYLAARTGRTPGDILNEVRKGKQTWGSLLNSQGIEMDTVGHLIAERFRKVGR